MRDRILEHLHAVEKEYDVKVLFAVESGSRAWGFESKDSDWDVRFIYVHNLEWYLRIQEPRDVIEHFYDDDVDLVGWDLRKALRLFRKGNPTVSEWLHSSIVYYSDQEFFDRMLLLEKEALKPIKLMYHYYRIYNKHNERYLQHEEYPVKRFLYYLRGILSCEWVEKNLSVPPILFVELMNNVVDDEGIKSRILNLIELKKKRIEADMFLIDPELVEYAKAKADYFVKATETFRPKLVYSGYDSFDKLLFDMVNRR